tara:strand:+ start:734 stop:1114 length:381 start_codon:yes stop_codon:yes gene_type:complete
MKKIKFLYVILIFFLLIHFKFFENVYLVLKYDFHERLISNYGYCGGTSYGFVKYIDNKYKFKKNLRIYNDDKSFPYSEAFVHKPKQEYENNYIVVLNYNELNSSIDIKNYSIVEKFQNCLYLKKND